VCRTWTVVDPDLRRSVESGYNHVDKPIAIQIAGG
jgi:hypothetical protein